MHLNARNVNHAFRLIVDLIHTGKVPTVELPSRAGPVWMINDPVLLSYTHPAERVLFNTGRDANPFFHLFESLWMLAGRNDVAPLAYYNSQIAAIASDDGETFNGAYGYRWRNRPRYASWPTAQGPKEGWMQCDQLAMIIDHLRDNPYSRRAVLQMWTVEDDLLKIDTTKDVCCNTCAYFAIETGLCSACNGKGCVDTGEAHGIEKTCPRCNGLPHDQPAYLNMTVSNRSNDLIWGMLGANAVHFSFLQEYVALALGLKVGTYHHFTNNLHVYKERWTPERWSKDHDPPRPDNPRRIPLMLPGKEREFDEECAKVVARGYPKFGEEDRPPVETYNNQFLDRVAVPMLSAWFQHKRRRYTAAFDCLDRVEDDDWRTAGRHWMAKRSDAYQRRTADAAAD